jgi:hypothetical protein
MNSKKVVTVTKLAVCSRTRGAEQIVKHLVDRFGPLSWCEQTANRASDSNAVKDRCP